jgi:hypothetical protein
MRHEEMHERPQLHQVILQWSACQQQPTLGIEVQEGLPPLGLEVLHKSHETQVIREPQSKLEPKDTLIL